MNLPLEGEVARWMAIPFGMAFGYLLHRSRVADYNVIVNQFRLRDATMLKVMMTAIVIGGIGVYFLHDMGLAKYHIKPANLLGVSLGAAIFAIGLVLLGYCPGTGLAALAGGSLHALVGLAGMLAGGILYGLSYPWVEKHIQTVGALGKVRLSELTGIPDILWFIGMAMLLGLAYVFTTGNGTSRDTEAPANTPKKSPSQPSRTTAWDI